MHSQGWKTRASQGNLKNSCWSFVANSLDFDRVKQKASSYTQASDFLGHENTRLFGHESAEDIVHKFVFLSDDRNIKEVWVNGQKVKDTIVSNV